MSNTIDSYTDFTQLLLKALKSIKGKDIEIEIRYGIIQDTFTRERFKITALHPILIEYNSPQVRFVPGIDLGAYKNILKKFSDLECEKKVTKDKVYCCRSGRFTFKDDVCVEAIKKIRHVTYDIYNPMCDYDMRLSICREKKLKVKGLNELEVLSERLRERTSFNVGDAWLDCTIVKVGNNLGYEVELEVNNDDFCNEKFLKTMFEVFK